MKAAAATRQLVNKLTACVRAVRLRLTARERQGAPVALSAWAVPNARAFA